MAPSPTSGFLRGTLDTLLLKSLVWGPCHGYAVARWLEQRTEESLRIEEGSLYPALYRLEKRGLVEAEWGSSESGRRVKLYRLTAAGRARLEEEAEDWRKFASAVHRVLSAEAP